MFATPENGRYVRDIELMMDDILEGFLKLCVKVVKYIFFETCCYLLGWPVLKILTFGKYPDQGWLDCYIDGEITDINNWSSTIVSLIGLLVIVLFLGLLIW